MAVPETPKGSTATGGDGQVALSWDTSTDSSITEHRYSYWPTGEESDSGSDLQRSQTPNSGYGETNDDSYGDSPASLMEPSTTSWYPLLIREGGGGYENAVFGTPYAAGTDPPQSGAAGEADDDPVVNSLTTGTSTGVASTYTPVAFPSGAAAGDVIVVMVRTSGPAIQHCPLAYCFGWVVHRSSVRRVLVTPPLLAYRHSRASGHLTWPCPRFRPSQAAHQRLLVGPPSCYG